MSFIFFGVLLCVGDGTFGGQKIGFSYLFFNFSYAHFLA